MPRHERQLRGRQPRRLSHASDPAGPTVLITASRWKTTRFRFDDCERCRACSEDPHDGIPLPARMIGNGRLKS
jgi:hypothetical protein